MNAYGKSCIKNIVFYVFLLFLLEAVLPYQAKAIEDTNQTTRAIPDEEIPIILELIANDIRENYERIKTWSGEIDVKINRLWTGASAEGLFNTFTDSKGETPETILQKVEEEITFAINSDKNFVYVDNFRKKNQYLNIIGNDLGRKFPSPIRSVSIANPDFLIESQPQRFDDKGNITGMRAVKKSSQKEERTGLYRDFDDPRRIFTPGEFFPWDFHKRLNKRLDSFGNLEFDGYRLKMEEQKSGEVIEYVMILPSVVNTTRKDPNNYIIQTRVFSSKYSFNLTHWKFTNGGGLLIKEFIYEFELVDGIYLPNRVIEKHYRPNGDISSEKECTYINKVNQEISPGTFEITNLKLKDGDYLVDEVSKEEYQYESATHTFKLAEQKKRSSLPGKNKN